MDGTSPVAVLVPSLCTSVDGLSLSGIATARLVRPVLAPEAAWQREVLGDELALSAHPGSIMDHMIVVLWAAMFLCTFHTVVLARRDLLRAAAVLYWVTVLWAAAAPSTLGLDAPTDALIPTLLVFTAGGLLGKLVDWFRREQLGPPSKSGAQPSPTPTAPGALKHLN